MRRTGRARSGLIGLVLLLLASPAPAQTIPEGEGLKAGHFVLYPSLSLDYTRDDNVFYTSTGSPADEFVSSGIVAMRPRLLAHLPLGRGRVVWSYSPVFRNYTDARVSQSEKLSHFADLEASLKPGGILSITARYHFVHATVELREIDPGGETTFGLVPFTVQEPEVDFTLDVGARQGVSLIPRYSSVQFDEAGESVFFDYDRKGAEGRYNFKLSPTSTLYGYLLHDQTDQHREQVSLAEVGITSRTVGVGLRRTINQAVVTSFTGGYQHMEFTGAADQNFSGTVLNATATWILTDTTRLEVQGRRQPYQSFVEDNNYYINNYGGLRIAQQIGRKLYLLLSGSYQVNHYSEPDSSLGIRRRDKDRTVEIGVGYRFIPALRVMVGYNSNRRDSNYDLADYEVNRMTFRLEMGWL